MRISRFLRETVDSRYLIYYFVAGFALILLIYALVAEKTYLSEGQLLPQSDVSGLLELSGSIGGLAGQESKVMRIARAAGVSLGYSSADVIHAILMSRTVMEDVVKDCEIFRHYRIKKNSMEGAIKHLQTLTTVEITREEIVIIKCTGKTPELAAKLVNSYIKRLDEFLKEKSMSRGKNMRLFLEKRMAEAESDLQSTMDSLVAFQTRTKVIIPDEEMKAAIEAYASLKGQLFAKELQVQVSESYATGDNPYHAELKNEAESIRKKLNEIESKGILKDGFGAGFGVSLADIPDVMQVYFRKYLDVRIQEEIYSFLRQQYEQARIMEVKDTPIVTVLDWGRAPERKHSPRTLSLVLVGALIGLAIGVGTCVGRLGINDLLKNRDRKQTLMTIKDAIVDDVRRITSSFGHRMKR